eukprot:UN03105
MKLLSAFILVLAFAFLASFAHAAEVQLALNEWSEPIDVPAQAMAANDYFIVVDIEQEAREIVIRMRDVEGSDAKFDPDLYVKFGSRATRQDYDASDITDSHVHTIILSSADYQMATGTRLYIGVYGWSNVGGKVQLQAEVHGCGGMNCGGEARGICDPLTGECHCKSGFDALPMCNAETKALTLDTTDTNSLLAQQVAYHTVQLPVAPAKGWLKVHVKRTTRSNGAILVAIAKGESLPSANNNIESAYIFSFHSEVVLTVNPREYSQGKFTIGVINQKGPATYTINAKVEFCENDCSGHGTCNKDTSVCACERDYKLSPDCSVKTHELRFQDVQSIHFDPWEQMQFTIPISQAIVDAPMEIGIHLTANNDTAIVSGSYPTMYLNYYSSKAPSPSEFHAQSAYPATWDQTFYLPDTKLNKQGELQLMIYNGNTDMSYNLVLQQRVHCPPGCEAHGTCNAFGFCDCNVGWIGGSCQISEEKCESIVGVKHGTSGMWVFFLFVLFLAIAAAISAVVYSFFFYKEIPSAQPAELQYDPLQL